MVNIYFEDNLSNFQNLEVKILHKQLNIGLPCKIFIKLNFEM